MGKACNNDQLKTNQFGKYLNFGLMNFGLMNASTTQTLISSTKKLLHPGHMIDISLCNLSESNDFYVNLLALRGAFQQLCSILNVYSNNARDETNTTTTISDTTITQSTLFLAFSDNLWHRVNLIARKSSIYS